MKTKDAIIRLSQEIYLFSDRPDYCTPDEVRTARKVLQHVFGISEREMESYPPEDEV